MINQAKRMAKSDDVIHMRRQITNQARHYNSNRSKACLLSELCYHVRIGYIWSVYSEGDEFIAIDARTHHIIARKSTDNTNALDV